MQYKSKRNIDCLFAQHPFLSGYVSRDAVQHAVLKHMDTDFFEQTCPRSKDNYPCEIFLLTRHGATVTRIAPLSFWNLFRRPQETVGARFTKLSWFDKDLITQAVEFVDGTLLIWKIPYGFDTITAWLKSLETDEESEHSSAA